MDKERLTGIGTIIGMVLGIMVTASCIGFGQKGELPEKISLFDGETLDGWQTANPEHQDLWYVKDSIITGGDGEIFIEENTYLCTREEFEDFEFSCLFRLTGGPEGFINSGIQYRSKVVDGDIVGYQADIGDGFWGDIYDEHRRGKLVGGDLSVLSKILNKGGWNSYLIRCRGDLHEIYINGIQTARYVEADPSIPKKGVIGFQNHDGGKSKVEFKDVFITIFP